MQINEIRNNLEKDVINYLDKHQFNYNKISIYGGNNYYTILEISYKPTLFTWFTKKYKKIYLLKIVQNSKVTITRELTKDNYIKLLQSVLVTYNSCICCP